MRVHILLDGRDVAPGSAPKYIDILEKDLVVVRKMGSDAMIASGGGRMAVTMDRYEVSTEISTCHSVVLEVIVYAAGTFFSVSRLDLLEVN